MRFKEVISLSGLAQSTVGYSLTLLKNLGHVIQPKSQGPYFITDKGRGIIAPTEAEGIGIKVSDDKREGYSDNSNDSNEAPMSPFGEADNPSRTYSNNSNTPLGVGVDWSKAGAGEEDEGEL